MARRVFAATGFKTILIGAGIVGAFTTLANSFFTQQTPYPLIMIFLVTAGFARSFFFTGTNALSYSDIDDSQASQATSMASVLQQISLALGVAFAATILEVSSYISGSHLQLADFHMAFMIVAIVSLVAIAPLIAMDRSAGAAVSGHRGKASPAE